MNLDLKLEAVVDVQMLLTLLQTSLVAIVSSAVGKYKKTIGICIEMEA